MRYVLVTLIGKHKLYSMPLFWEYVQNLNIQPNKILISCTEDIFNVAIVSYSGNINIEWIHGEDDTGDDQIHSTTSAREALRQRILELGYEWSMWLDNDILVPPEMVDQFKYLLMTNPDLLYVNAFHPARQPGGKGNMLRHGLGSSFIHRDVLNAVPFIMCTMKGKNLGDDYIWKMIVSQFIALFNFKALSGLYFDVKHSVENGDIHELAREQRDQVTSIYPS